MKFKLDDANLILNHLVLQDHKIAQEVASTPEWKNDETFTANLQINGVEIPAEVIEEFFKDRYKMIENGLKAKYDADNIDKMVNDRALNLLKERADKVLDAMYKIETVLQSSEDILKPWWEEGEERGSLVYINGHIACENDYLPAVAYGSA